jgi:glycosyltransferase involved in cell wall biosynthesis
MSGRLTIAILTLNEARNLPRCFDHIPASYPIVLVDSGSSDGTLDIARARGARIYSNPWPGYAAQRNFALDHCAIDTMWTLYIDADEVFPLAFYDWFERWVDSPDTAQFDAGMIPSILIFKGVRLMHAPGYPIYHTRLLRTKTVRWVVNEPDFSEKIDAGARIINIEFAYDHYFYPGDLQAWMFKHIRYAGLETGIRRAPNAATTTRTRLSSALGETILRIPLRFIYHYFLRQGFRDGRAGFEYALIYTWFEATKYVLRCAGDRGAHPPQP